MVNMTIEKDLEEYIEKFRKNGEENLNAGNIEIIMIYSNECGACHKQFYHFKNYLGITFDNNMKSDARNAKELIADRILAIEQHDKWGKKLIKESDEWADKIKDRDKKIRFTPSWLDFETHEHIGTGFLVDNQLRDMTNKQLLKGRRTRFKENYHKIAGESCNKVACDLPSSFQIKPKKKEKKKNE